MLLNVVAKLLCRAIHDGRINSDVPLTTSDVVDISLEVVNEAEEKWPNPHVAFEDKFILVKRELVDTGYIPASLWREIQEEAIGLLPIDGQYHAVIEDDRDGCDEPSHEQVEVKLIGRPSEN